MPSFDIDTYYGSEVVYEKYEPGQSTIQPQISWDGGQTWINLIAGEELPNLDYGQDLEGMNFMVKTQFTVEKYDARPNDMPHIKNFTIKMVEDLIGEILWLGEDGQGFDNNIEYGMDFNTLTTDDTHSQNLWIKTSGLPFRVRTRDYNFDMQAARHQIRKLLLEIMASGGTCTVNIYADDELTESKELDLKSGSDNWGPGEDVLIWNQGKWGPYSVLNEIIKSAGTENIGSRISIEIEANDQTYFAIKTLWSEVFHRRKI